MNHEQKKICLIEAGIDLEKQLSLYVHLPFCKQKCFYCDFNSYGDCSELIPDYCQALLIEFQRFLPQPFLIPTIYFGGGTPSVVPSESLASLLLFLTQHFTVDRQAEITIEINPGTVTANDLFTLREAGFNRLSIGLQAVQNRLLKEIGRIHTWEAFTEVYHQARVAGFTNINVDLISGLPGQSLADWQSSLTEVTALKPEHISAYSLQVEPGTPIAAMIESGKQQLPDEDEVVAMLQMTLDCLRQNGYEHYEISNYARKGFQSRHNLGYWLGRDYLGFGAGASSTYQQQRWINHEQPQEYIQNLQMGLSIIADLETIDPTQQITETLMLRLRMRDGIDLNKFASETGCDLQSQASTELQQLRQASLITVVNNRLRLTDQGVFVSNLVIAELLKTL